jgi:hypothetical protein
MSTVGGVVELFCSLVVGRVELILSGLGYMATGRAVGVVVRGGSMRLEVDDYLFSSYRRMNVLPYLGDLWHVTPKSNLSYSNMEVQPILARPYGRVS